MHTKLLLIDLQATCSVLHCTGPTVIVTIFSSILKLHFILILGLPDFYGRPMVLNFLHARHIIFMTDFMLINFMDVIYHYDLLYPISYFNRHEVRETLHYIIHVLNEEKI